jgi:hypothetical protein
MLWPEPEQGKKISDELLKKLEKLGKTRHAAEQRLSQARMVLRHSPERARAVRAAL